MIGRTMRQCVAALLAAACAAAVAGPDPDPGRSGLAALTRLASLMESRLALMPDVARHKWNHGGAIEDLPREQALAERFGAQAQALGVPAAWATDYLQAQMDAAKRVQRDCFAIWSRPGADRPADGPDLQTQLRPQLDALQQPLLQTLAEAWPVLSDPAQAGRVALTMNTLWRPGANRAAVTRATAPLLDGSAWRAVEVCSHYKGTLCPKQD